MAADFYFISPVVATNTPKGYEGDKYHVKSMDGRLILPSVVLTQDEARSLAMELNEARDHKE